MKLLKHSERTFETLGYVQYEPNEELQQPHDCQLPAFISFIDGTLTYLRVGATREQVREESPNCLEYDLRTPEGKNRLVDSDIIEIHFEIPTHVKLEKWRKDAEQKRETHYTPEQAREINRSEASTSTFVRRLLNA